MARTIWLQICTVEKGPMALSTTHSMKHSPYSDADSRSPGQDFPDFHTCVYVSHPSCDLCFKFAACSHTHTHKIINAYGGVEV